MKSAFLRRAALAIAMIASAATLVASLPAQSATLAPSKVTAYASTLTPASGQVFTLHGALRSAGEKVPATIRVKTFRNGEWVRVIGAVVQTNRDNTYNLRVILQMKGERLLRVIGHPADDSIQTARTTITVTVQ